MLSRLTLSPPPEADRSSDWEDTDLEDSEADLPADDEGTSELDFDVEAQLPEWMEEPLWREAGFPQLAYEDLIAEAMTSEHTLSAAAR